MKRFNIMAAKKYPKQDGTQGTKWIKLGAVSQKEDGSFFGELECLPTGAWFDGTINLYPIEQQGQNNQQSSYKQPQQTSGYNPNNYGNYRG